MQFLWRKKIQLLTMGENNAISKKKENATFRRRPVTRKIKRFYNIANKIMVQ